MRARLSATQLNRLRALEQQQGDQRPVMMVPRRLDVAEWESVAAPGQAMLKDNIADRDAAPDYSALPPELTAHLRLVVNH